MADYLLVLSDSPEGRPGQGGVSYRASTPAEQLTRLEYSLGVRNSDDPLSLDYLTRNPLSVNPGHLHTGVYAPVGNYITALTGEVTAAGPGSVAATIASGAVTLAKMANLAANSLIGNNTGDPATPLALTASQVKTLLSLNDVENTALSTWAGTSNLLHSNLGNLTIGDPHTQYALADGSRAFSNAIYATKSEAGIANLLYLSNSHSQVNGYGSAIIFRAKADGEPYTVVETASVQGVITDIDTLDGALIFQTLKTGTLTEAARFNSSGQLGVNMSPLVDVQASIGQSAVGIATILSLVNTHGAQIDGGVGIEFFAKVHTTPETLQQAASIQGIMTAVQPGAGALIFNVLDPTAYGLIEAARFNDSGQLVMNSTKVTGLAAASATGDAVRYDEWIAAQDPGHKHSKLWASDGSPEAVTVDPAGNVGIGTTTPSVALDVGSGAASSHIGIRINGGTDAAHGTYLELAKGGAVKFYLASQSALEGGSTSDDTTFWTNGAYNMRFSPNCVERVRIDSGGNVGIGTTTAAAKCAINGGLNVGADTDPGDNNLYVVGDCSALTFTDRTRHFQGDAIAAIKAIKGKLDHPEDLDHATLPEFARKTTSLTDIEGIITQEEARDIGAMVTMLTVGFQQLCAQIEALQQEQLQKPKQN